MYKKHKLKGNVGKSKPLLCLKLFCLILLMNRAYAQESARILPENWAAGLEITSMNQLE